MNENKKWYLYLAVLLIGLVFCFWYIFGRSYDSSSTIEIHEIGADLSGARDGVKKSVDELTDYRRRLRDAEYEVSELEDTTTKLRERHGSDRKSIEKLFDLNREGRAIFEDIRNSNQEGAETP